MGAASLAAQGLQRWMGSLRGRRVGGGKFGKDGREGPGREGSFSACAVCDTFIRIARTSFLTSEGNGWGWGGEGLEAAKLLFLGTVLYGGCGSSGFSLYSYFVAATHFFAVVHRNVGDNVWSWEIGFVSLSSLVR